MHIVPGVFWKQAPFVKLLLPFAAGILVQYYASFPVSWARWLALLSFAGTAASFALNRYRRFRLQALQSAGSSLLFFSLGVMLTWERDIRHSDHWFGHHLQPGDALVITLEEPPLERTKTFRALARVDALLRSGHSIPVRGKLLCYFTKDSLPLPGMGSRLLMTAVPEGIRAAGNPGGFDYRRYCLFRGITHQAFLKRTQFAVLPGNGASAFQHLLQRSREKILQLLRRYVPGEKEAGLAEALLLGYKNDLDPSLVQAYAQTGVVHVIAISGLHLALVYGLLVFLLNPLGRTRKGKWLRALLIIAGLWLFSLLAGAQPSILRAAFLFTCMVAGQALSRKTQVYNSLAFSAFGLLLINPFWLWDAGFQLSYTAVLSILLFQRPIYNWFFIENRILDQVWKLNAVTLAAQVLTLPVILYQFHQFPNYFLLTNLVAVPLSGIILLTEIFLCAISFFGPLAGFAGRLTGWMIEAMNRYVESISLLPGAQWTGLQVSFLQVLLLYLCLAGGGHWLMSRSPRSLGAGLIALLGFAALRTVSFIEHGRQRLLIVYQVPSKSAVDFIEGRRFLFAGDSALLQDEVSVNFSLAPARTLYRVSGNHELPSLLRRGPFISFGGRHICWIREAHYLERSSPPAWNTDLLLLSGEARLRLPELCRQLGVKQVVADASVPAWKAARWKREADSLNIPFHEVRSAGAFVMPLR